MNEDDIRSHPGRFINREMSWLSFNHRVLAEAENRGYPLLERLRFLTISADNLNEFLMVRIAGLAGQVRENVSTLSDNGQTPVEQLATATREIERLQLKQHEIYRDLAVELQKEGVEVLGAESLNKEQRAWAEDHFLSYIFPMLTPLCIDPAHPFPFVPNLGLTLVATLSRVSDNKPMTALVRLPQPLKRFVPLPNDEPLIEGVSTNTKPLHQCRRNHPAFYGPPVSRLRYAGKRHVSVGA